MMGVCMSGGYMRCVCVYEVCVCMWCVCVCVIGVCLGVRPLWLS